MNFFKVRERPGFLMEGNTAPLTPFPSVRQLPGNLPVIPAALSLQAEGSDSVAMRNAVPCLNGIGQFTFLNGCYHQESAQQYPELEVGMELVRLVRLFLLTKPNQLNLVLATKNCNQIRRKTGPIWL